MSRTAYRSLRKITPGDQLLRRRAAGASLRELAPDAGVSHQALSAFFKRPEVVARMRSFERVERSAEAPDPANRRQRHASPPPSDRRPDGTGALLRQPSTARLGDGGVPSFPNTPEGQAERLAYYEARKLNHLPNSLYDYHDVIHGRETPAERRARERDAGRRR